MAAGVPGFPHDGACAGRPWGIAAIVLFLAMVALAFVQRAITGL